MSQIVFLNHKPSQCGVYEIGKRIHSLLTIGGVNSVYIEIDGEQEYRNSIEEHHPDYIIYNYFPGTMPFLNTQLIFNFDKCKHLAIIHDPLEPNFIKAIEQTFDAWIIHDDTNKINSHNKFLTVRPISRFARESPVSFDKISIGSHGFNCSPWKMYDRVLKLINDSFNNIEINLNISQATFGHSQQLSQIEEWKKNVSKSDIRLNITNTYFKTELELIQFLAKNTMNIYFYDSSQSPYFGVGGSADLAISAQSSLCVNSTYMYRHIHKHLGFFEEYQNFDTFIKNADEVKKLYEEWSPQNMANGYIKMLESF